MERSFSGGLVHSVNTFKTFVTQSLTSFCYWTNSIIISASQKYVAETDKNLKIKLDFR